MGTWFQKVRAAVCGVGSLPGCSDLCAAEDHASVGDGLHLILRVVGVGVVAGAEEASVGEVGVAAAAPGGVVVDVAHRGGPVAALCGAVLVAVPDRDPLVPVVEPLLA